MLKIMSWYQINYPKHSAHYTRRQVNLLKPTGYVMHQQV